MKRTAKCRLCDYTVTKNGEWATIETVQQHAWVKHAEEMTQRRVQWIQLSNQIIELKKKQGATEIYEFTN